MRDLPRGTQVADLRRTITFAYGAVTLYGLPFLTGSTSDRLCNSAGTNAGFRVQLLQPQFRNGCNLLR
jgi:hypothetical protein